MKKYTEPLHKSKIYLDPYETPVMVIFVTIILTIFVIMLHRRCLTGI